VRQSGGRICLLFGGGGGVRVVFSLCAQDRRYDIPAIKSALSELSGTANRVRRVHRVLTMVTSVGGHQQSLAGSPADLGDPTYTLYILYCLAKYQNLCIFSKVAGSMYHSSAECCVTTNLGFSRSFPFRWKKATSQALNRIGMLTFLFNDTWDNGSGASLLNKLKGYW
jgi:hypothetical protein